MGEHKVSLLEDSEEMRRFMRLVLTDVQAIEYMIEHEWFEDDVVRIGAEQEMVLVNRDNMKPAPVAVEALELLKDCDWVESELARFNLETNLTPRVFTDSCFSEMEKENLDNLNVIRDRLVSLNADILLVGILPTLRKEDVEEDNLMPLKRYRALMNGIRNQMAKDSFELKLSGIDELNISHNSPLLEACNTSFQVHLQVNPSNFVQMYNMAQALAGPVLSIAANSPLVFGKRLWHENRIALFQQSIDTRATSNNMRDRSPRVQFGKDWIHHSILDIYKEDIMRFRVLLGADVKENSMESVAKGVVPNLKALQVHNGTIYRWNRPCYGISENGKPHLRIENRVFSSGPTVRDEVANSAFWLGAMIGMANRYHDIRHHLSFEDVSDNFGKAAYMGMDSQFNWMDNKKISVTRLILDELLPIAEEGLESQGVYKDDISTYLSVIKARCENQTNGARWQLKAFTQFSKETTKDEALSAMTACYLNNQIAELPIHAWENPSLNEMEYYNPTDRTVGDLMSTDILTVQEDDIIQLVAEMMEWKKLHYTLVEDKQGKLVGLISLRMLVKFFTRKESKILDDMVSVKDIMIKDIKTVSPNTNIIDAMDLMQENDIGCLPIIQDGNLVGLIDTMDLLNITGRVMRRMKKQKSN